mgnify:CR=1 FL=1
MLPAAAVVTTAAGKLSYSESWSLRRHAACGRLAAEHGEGRGGEAEHMDGGAAAAAWRRRRASFQCVNSSFKSCSWAPWSRMEGRVGGGNEAVGAGARLACSEIGARRARPISDCPPTPGVAADGFVCLGDET